MKQKLRQYKTTVPHGGQIEPENEPLGVILYYCIFSFCHCIYYSQWLILWLDLSTTSTNHRAAFKLHGSTRV